MADEGASIEASNPVVGSIKVRGTDVVSVLTILFVAGIAFVLYQHLIDTKAQGVQFVSALQELTQSQKEGNKQQRLLTCIVSRPEVERKKEFGDANSFCQQVTQFPGR